jgi:predicted nucleic acid-binding protein
LDTNIFVAFFDGSSPRYQAARDLISNAVGGQFHAILSSQNILEISSVLINGYKIQSDTVVSDVRAIIEQSVFSIVYPDSATIELYLRYVAKHSHVHTTDLFLAATMVSHGISSIITNDRDFEKIPGIRVYNPFRP